MYTQLQTVKKCIIYQTIGQCVSNPVAYENLRMYIKIQGILNFDNMPWDNLHLQTNIFVCITYYKGQIIKVHSTPLYHMIHILCLVYK